MRRDACRVLARGWLLLAAALTLPEAACSRGSEVPDAARADAPSTDVGRPLDAAAARCDADSDCDDGIACTLDACVVGNVCDHVALDSECASGEHCAPSIGCTSGTSCTTNDECDDGLRCTGVEQCLLGSCRTVESYVCNDGNGCTDDVCAPDIDDCRFTRNSECDGGVRVDAGPGCDPFDAATGFAGTFDVFPAQSSSCGRATYSIDAVTFSVVGAELHVVAGPFTLVGALPSDGSFHVEATDAGCGTYALDGEFRCSDVFAATWTATFTGACALCSNQNASVSGLGR